MGWSGQWFRLSGGWHLLASDLPEVRAGAVRVPRGSTGRSKSKEDAEGDRGQCPLGQRGARAGGGDDSQESSHGTASRSRRWRRAGTPGLPVALAGSAGEAGSGAIYLALAWRLGLYQDWPGLDQCPNVDLSPCPQPSRAPCSSSRPRPARRHRWWSPACVRWGPRNQQQWPAPPPRPAPPLPLENPRSKGRGWRSPVGLRPV